MTTSRRPAKAGRKAAAQKAAPIGEVQKAATTWKTPILYCRLFGHTWKQTKAEHILRYHYWYVEFICERKCGVRKWEEWSETGMVQAKSMVYPVDKNGHHTYLLEGFGRVSGEARGVLRLETVIRFSGAVEVNGNSDHDEDNMPRSSKTERYLKENNQWPSS